MINCPSLRCLIFEVVKETRQNDFRCCENIVTLQTDQFVLGHSSL